jgi:hypothetical protein
MESQDAVFLPQCMSLGVAAWTLLFYPNNLHNVTRQYHRLFTQRRQLPHPASVYTQGATNPISPLTRHCNTLDFHHPIASIYVQELRRPLTHISTHLRSHKPPHPHPKSHIPIIHKPPAPN